MQQLRVNNCQVSYRREGAGKAVVLLHGFGEDHKVFDDLIVGLSSEYLVIAPDIPGSGNSEYQPQLKSLTDIAEIINSIAEHECLDKITVIGHSMGGYIALAYAEKYPEKIEKLGLFHSTALPDSEEKKQGREKSIQFIEKSGSERFLKEMIPGLFGKETAENNPELIQQTFEQYKTFNPEALIQYYRLMMARPDRTDVLKHAKFPFLLILGEQDSLIPLEKGLELAKLAAFTQVEIFTQSGHMGMLEEPEKAIRVVKEFLQY